jgi:hypothetical protein
LLAARIYQGQTTNLRTAGGGFAPVLTTSAPADWPDTCGEKSNAATAQIGTVAVTRLCQVRD